MTPKDKAKYLVDIYYYYLFQSDVIQRTYWSKQCALIAVNEILDSSPMYYTGYDYESNLEYWQEVKTEIKKL